jgi:hypothetical protein
MLNSWDRAKFVVRHNPETINLALATEESSRVKADSLLGTSILRAFLALALMAVSASCLLKYMWWTACYSAWNGIPKLAQQWQQAGVHASVNGWSFLLLEAAAIVTLIRLIKLRQLSGLVRYAIRTGVSLLIAVVVTGAFALFLSWTQIGTR